MNKNIFKLATILFALLSVTSVSALQINLTLADDFINNQDELNIDLEFFYAIGTGPYDLGKVSQTIDGLEQTKINDYLNVFNKMFANVTPTVSVNNDNSHISLGFKKNGIAVYPATCSFIQLQVINNINVSETGCIVS